MAGKANSRRGGESIHTFNLAAKVVGGEHIDRKGGESDRQTGGVTE